MSKNEAQSDGQPDQIKNALLSNAIHATLEIENNFKLYSYRMSDMQSYLNRMDELCTTYLEAKKSIVSKIEVND